MSVNKAILIGNLGADPELRYTTNGLAVSELRIATSRKWTCKDNSIKKDTQWHRVVVWGRLAENCMQYLSKGREVYVEGRLQTRQWEDRDKVKRFTTEIVAEQVQFLGAKTALAAGPEETRPSPEDCDNSAGLPDDEIPF